MSRAPGGERCSGRGGEDESVGLAAWTARRVGWTGRVGQGIEVKTLTTDLDIYRSAQLLVEQHGADALIEAALKADELLVAGDIDGQAVWMRIRTAVLDLLKRGDGEVVH